jgi:ribonuclease T2
LGETIVEFEHVLLTCAHLFHIHYFCILLIIFINIISFCTDEKFDEDVAVEVGWETMTTYWPDVQYQETDSNYDEFWTHEWEKHGTCSGLSQYDYFNYATQLIQTFGTPSAYTAAATGDGTMNANDLRDDFGGASMASLQCSSGKYINGVYTCWSTVNGVPTTQVVCPSDVQVCSFRLLAT